MFFFFLFSNCFFFCFVVFSFFFNANKYAHLIVVLLSFASVTEAICRTLNSIIHVRATCGMLLYEFFFASESTSLIYLFLPTYFLLSTEQDVQKKKENKRRDQFLLPAHKSITLLATYVV